MTKPVPNKRKKSGKPAKVLNETMRERVKRGYEDKSKSDSPGKVYDTTEDTSPMPKQKNKAMKKKKRGYV